MLRDDCYVEITTPLCLHGEVVIISEHGLLRPFCLFILPLRFTRFVSKMPPLRGEGHWWEAAMFG